jgi:ribonuclease D
MRLISSAEELRQASVSWQKDLGIDIECENNLHHYGSYLSIVQLSDGKESWIVDAMSIKELGPLISYLQDWRYQKIFHDTSFDLRILASEINCRPRNVFDTQLAVRFLGIKDLGLAALLEKYFGIKKKSKFQMADWTKRPLDKDMLEYAEKDTLYLLRLRDLLSKELKAKGMLAWVEDEMRHNEKKEYRLCVPNYDELAGVRRLTPKQLGVLKELYEEREFLAQKVDRPVHFIFSNKRLKEFAVSPPDWSNLKGVHPIVRRYARAFEARVRNARPIRLPPVPRLRYTPEQIEFQKRLLETRDRLSAKIGLDRNLLLSKDDVHELTLGRDNMRVWQKYLFRDFLLKANVPSIQAHKPGAPRS